ncbi:MAG: DUF3526 domain-containing protein [Pseudomonadota bacterium]
MLHDLKREWWFFCRDRQAVATIVTAAILAVGVVWLGLADVAAQRDEIAFLSATTQSELETALAHQGDAGSAAYYGFRMALAPPNELTFAARGVREELPWKHRLRILALEGQIYESDAGNPELEQTGRIDFAFLISVLAPLLVILLLHDVVDGERRHKRLDLLTATAGVASSWASRRVLIRTAMLSLALVLPLMFAALLTGAAPDDVIQLSLISAAYVTAWGYVVLFVAHRIESAATVATTLLCIWVTLTLLIPLGGATYAERQYPVPEGGQILLQQRETVNDAWDLPHTQTMNAFAASHPEWQAHTKLDDGFDWKWYYAFQQLGDESVADLSRELRDGVRARDQVMAKVAWLSPPLFVERRFSRLARTDITAFQNYESCARDYHAYLRHAQYPMLFGVEQFDLDKLLALESVRYCKT